MAHFLYYIFPHQVGQIASLVIDEFIKLASAGYGETEFRRAKKQLQVGQLYTQSMTSKPKAEVYFWNLQSMLLMNLESRPVVFEDLARQVLSNGERKQPEYYIERIEAVTAQDLNREPSNRTNIHICFKSTAASKIQSTGLINYNFYHWCSAAKVLF